MNGGDNRRQRASGDDRRQGASGDDRRRLTDGGELAADGGGDRTAVAAAARQRARALRRLAFGDRGGLVVFLAALVVLGLLWRVDVLLNDSETYANLLVNVADGRLSVVDAPYSLTAREQPGLGEVGGRLYGRNYGQVYLAVPVLWILDALAAVVDLRLLLAAGWSLAVVALGRAGAGLLDRPRVADAGAVLGLGAFAAALLAATPIDWVEPPRPIVALGFVSILAAAVGATALYRLLAWAHGRREGLAGGLALVLATPVGFWGPFPKRHVLTASALLLTCYLFAVSRTGTDRRATLARAGAYAVLGYLAAIHAFEGAFALAVLAPVDVLSAPANDRRTLAVVGAVLLVSLGPMLATNAAISGDPFEPPRLLPHAQGDLAADAGGAPDAGGGPGDGPGDPGGDGPDGGGQGETSPDAGPSLLDRLGPVGAVLGAVGWIAAFMLAFVEAGFAALLEPDRLSHVVVRSGWIPGIRYHLSGFEAIELALLEVLPLAGALAWLPVTAGRRLRERRPTWRRLRTALADPVRQTDLLVAGLALSLFVVYLPELPVHASITVRYVVPVTALALYGVCRLAPVRAALRDAPRTLGTGYLATVAVGGVGYALALAVLDPAVGEAMQLHALVGLATAAVLALASATWPRHRRPAALAGTLALAAGATTLLLAFAGLVYFADGTQALDLARLAGDLLGPAG